MILKHREINKDQDKKFSHLMVDLESLGKTADAVILSIGSVPFDMNGEIGESFEVFPQVQSQIKDRKIEWSTIKWWFDQDDIVRRQQADAERHQNLKDCLYSLDFFIQWHCTDNFRIWANGASFDTPMLNHAYDQFGMETPWSYRNQLDTRTMVYMSKISVRKYDSSGIQHSAVDDCKWQISWLVDAYNILKGS